VDAKRRVRLLPIIISLVIAYVAAIPNRAGRDVVVRRAWTVSTALPGAAVGAAGEGEGHAFRVGNTFGYVSPSGALERLERVYTDVALDDGYYANYSKGGDAIALRRRDGGLAASLTGSGWPLLDDRLGEAVMVFSPDLLGLAEYAPDGARRWERELGSFATCFAAFPSTAAAGDARCAVGTLDGYLRVLGKDGSDLFRVGSTGSRIPGSYGCAVSPEGRQVIAALGLEPQRLVAFERTGGTFREAWSRVLDVEVRAERLMCYSRDSRYLLMDGGRGIVVVDTRGRGSWVVAGRGVVFAATAVGGEVAVELREENGSGELLLLALPNVVLARASIPAGGAPERFLAGHDGYVLFGAYEHLERLDILRS